MSRVHCVSIPGQTSALQYGLLHEPDRHAARGVCLLLLSPGIKGRVGPHRLYVKIAAHLVRLGFHVLRFDFPGLGDSQGTASETVLADMYNSILSGRYVDDTIAAMDWMESNYDVRRFVGSGLCGGAMTALLTASVDLRIECLLGIGLPTVLEGGPEDWARALTRHQISDLRTTYLSKLANPASWARFASGHSDYRAIWRVIMNRFVVRTSRAVADTPRVDSLPDNVNPRFADAFTAMLESARTVLLVYSGADRLGYQFRETFEKQHGEKLRGWSHHYQVHFIERANHILSDTAWVAELCAVAEAWLVGHYGQVASPPQVDVVA